MAVGFRRGVKAIQECKLQGIGSYRAVEYIGIGTHGEFVTAGDLLPQGICCRRGFITAGDLLLWRICYYGGFIAIRGSLPQGIYCRRGFIRVGDKILQEIYQSRGLVSIGRQNIRALAPVGDLFKQRTYLSRGLILLRPLFRRYRAASNRLGSGLYILQKYKAYIGQQGVGT